MNPIIRFSPVNPRGGNAAAPLPFLVTPPIIAGAGGAYHNRGVQMNATPGVWENTISVTGQWLRNGAPIPGATTLSYVIPNNFSDGESIVYQETATNEDLISTTANSNTIIADLPEEIVTVVIEAPDGADDVGDVLSIQTPASFSNGVLTTSYQWYRVGPGAIPGATASTYAIQPDDQGYAIFLRVTGANSYGSNNSDSNAILAGLLPVSTSPPTISGWVDGKPVTRTSPGSWDYATSTSGQWRKNGVDVPGETGTTYGGTFAQGDTIVYRSTASNANGSAFVDSNSILIGITFAPLHEGSMDLTFMGNKGMARNYAPVHEGSMDLTFTGTKTP